MREVLEPLGRIAGVRMAVLVSLDGVPVVVRGRETEDERGVDLSAESADSLAALASGWLHGLTRSIAPLSWEPPRSVVLRAARGTLIMLHAPGSVLLVLLDSGTHPEDLQLPMEGAVARIQRILRSRHVEPQPAESPEEPPYGYSHGAAEPPPAYGAGPKSNAGQDPRFVPTDTARKPIPRDLPG